MTRGEALTVVKGEPFGHGPLDPRQDLAGTVLTFVVRAIGGETDLIAVALAEVAQDPPAPWPLFALALPASETTKLTPGVVYRYKVRAPDDTTIIGGPLLVRSTWG